MNTNLDGPALAASMVALIQRFVGNQPDALEQMRVQVRSELEAAVAMKARAEAQLVALDQLQALMKEGNEENHPGVPALAAPPLKTAIVRVLNENPDQAWDRESLYAEIVRRGWGPGGTNPRNTFTSRLRDLELGGLVRRIDRNIFTSTKNEVPAM
jgi:hypothetical protein